MSIIDTYNMQEGIAKYIRSGAVPTLKHVEWTDIDRPCTNGETIYLPQLNANATAKDILLFRYKAEHELGHEDPTNAHPHWKTLMEANKDDLDDTTRYIWNLLSDYVQEHNRVGQYPGRDMVLLQGRELFLAEHIFPQMRKMGAALRRPDDPPVTAETLRLNALFVLDNRNRATWNPHITPKDKGLPKAMLDVADQLASVVDWNRLRNEADALAAARTLRKWFDDNPLPPAPAGGSGDELDSDPEDTPTDDTGMGGSPSSPPPSSPSFTKPPPAGKSSKAKRTKGKTKGGSSESASSSSSDPDSGGSAPTPNPDLEAAAAEALERMEGHTDTSSDPPPDRHKSGAYILRKGVPMEATEQYSRYYSNTPTYFANRTEGIRRVRAVAKSRASLPAQVRRYFMTLKRDRYTTGYRSGRLDTGRLPDVLRGRDDIFRRLEHRHTVNSAVSLLVDCSGSMRSAAEYAPDSPTHIINAMASAYMLAEALAGIGVAVEINGFTEYDSSEFVYHGIKKYDQRWNPNATLERMGDIMPCLLQNPDGEAILRAYHDLKQRTEPRKVLIVLSDGCPEGYGHRDNGMEISTFTRKVVEEIQIDKNVQLFCIGLGGHNPASVGYRNVERVHNTNQLGTVLLNLVRRAIR